MSEKLIVKNFGPIKHVELDIKKVNVLIGEQGTGKSALVRLLNLFTSEGFLFGDVLGQASLLNMYGFFFNPDTYIRYETPNYNLVLNKEKFTINFIGTYKETLQRFLQIGVELFEKHNFVVSDEYYSLKEWFAKNIGFCAYIPAERIGIITSTQRRNDVGNSDQYIIDFNNYFLQSIKIKELKIPYLKNVLYKRENNKDIVIINGEELLLYQTSSGFQSSIPMAVCIEYFTATQDKIRFVIEEPELNLFPTTQYDLIKFIIDKTSSSKNSLFLASHSPYILTSLNNLMYAYQVGQSNENKVSQKIENKYWLDPNDVSAYMMKSDGTVENIIDEDGLIKAEKIDEVSKIINKEFNDIMDIELGVDEATK